jgi:glycosyltransferase involved in cell wall biosynthesis
MRVALAHDWLTGMRGGEKVLEVLCELYPDADLFTLFHRPGTVSPLIERRRIVTSFVQHLPFASTRYRNYLPLFPLAVRQFALDGYDLVISTSHCAVKSIRTPGHVRHICYCHSPMRYAWDQFDAYFGPARVGAVRSRLFYRPTMRAMAAWDAATASRVDRFVANSAYVAARIRRYYNRAATVVYPPVDTAFFQPGARAPEAHFLIVSALVPYKRIELAIDACAIAKVPLRIAGDGPERERLEIRASSATAGTLKSTVTFLGPMSGDRLRDEYRCARAVLLPGEEDFGIVPVEAQACGTPVIAFGRGGALETVKDSDTGVLFGERTASSLAAALSRFGQFHFDPCHLHAHAERFSRDRHIAGMKAVIAETVAAPEGAQW